MAVTAQSILDKVRLQLIDTGTSQRWTDAELLAWMSEAQRVIVAAVPSASYKRGTVALTTGTRQSLPADGYKLLDIPRNLTAAGEAGAPCTSVDRQVLDRQNLNWHVTGASGTVLHWTYDPNDPLTFFVYPRNDGTGSLEVVYSAQPANLTSGTSTLTVRDIFESAVTDYVLYRAHAKDSDFAAGMQLAQGYLGTFTAFVQAQAGGQQ